MSYAGEKLKVQFLKDNVMKQVETQAERYNPVKGRYEPVFNEDGSPEMVLRSYILLPGTSQYGRFTVSTEQNLRQVNDYDHETGLKNSKYKFLEFDTWENKTETLYGVLIKRDEFGDPLLNDEGKIQIQKLIKLQLTGKQLVAEFDSWKYRDRTQEHNENEEVESVSEVIKSAKELIEYRKNILPGFKPEDFQKPNRGDNMIL